MENTNNSLTAVAAQEGSIVSVVGDRSQAKECYAMKLGLLTNTTLDYLRYQSSS